VRHPYQLSHLPMTMTSKSLQRRKHELSDATTQITILSETPEKMGIPAFATQLKVFGLHPLKPTHIDTLQINVGKMCNQVCKHCHVDAGPDRKEIMTRETMTQCLEAIKDSTITTVDLTGGAPEMNPNFRWFVGSLFDLGIHVIVRCNLTIIVANKQYHDLPQFFKDHQVEVVSSLPYFAAKRTDAQRGEGVFEKSIKALQMLNAVGYGMPDSQFKLNLVYNPAGAFLPAHQKDLERQFKAKLKSQYDIEFHELYAITNLPISRFLAYLIQAGKYEHYMEELAQAFNPVAAQHMMCRNMISVGWDGYLYDCDFNQMLEIRVDPSASQHISDIDVTYMSQRTIQLNQHCYGCTAGSGSSCGGATV